MTRRDGIFESERAGRTERQVQHHSSTTVHSPNPAGGEVPTEQYRGKAPAPGHRDSTARPLGGGGK